MKTMLVGILFLAGCTATTPQDTAQVTPREPGRATYTSEQMRKTGRQTAGGQLEQLDPSVTVTRGGR